MMLKIKTTPAEKVWNLNLRVKVGDSVRHIGKDWANTSGINTEPNDNSSNWKSVGSSSLTSQEFVATAGQTDFNITNAPDTIQLVFTGRNLALPSEYSYNAGLLSFEVGRIVGTNIKAIY
jgi:hypothetical protein